MKLVVGIVLALGLAGTSIAMPVGTLSVANCSGGGVSVTGTTITWLPNGTVAGTGCVDTGIGTAVSYTGGLLGAGVAGNIKDLTAGGGAVDQFMTFTGTPLDFVLLALGPGVANTNCSGLAVGGTCSVFPGSPFVLTNLGGGNTGVALTASGTVSDGAGSNSWTGSFTTQLTMTPDAIQSTILAGGSVQSTHSGMFIVTPEPGTLSLLLGAGLVALGLKKRRKA